MLHLSLYLRDLLGFRAGGREESGGHGAGDTAVVGGGRGGLVVCRVHLRVVERLAKGGRGGRGGREGGRGREGGGREGEEGEREGGRGGREGGRERGREGEGGREGGRERGRERREGIGQDDSVHRHTLLYTVEPLFKDTSNKGHPSMKDTCFKSLCKHCLLLNL